MHYKQLSFEMCVYLVAQAQTLESFQLKASATGKVSPLTEVFVRRLISDVWRTQVEAHTTPIIYQC